MKIKLAILFILIFFSINAQNLHETEMINIKTDNNIDSKKLSIKLSEGTWKINVYPIFENNKIIKNSFPKNEGIYNLLINYSDNLFYIETVVYKTNPKFEKLEFNFYKENERIFCKIKSEKIVELNKEIVLNKFNEEMQNIINDSKK